MSRYMQNTIKSPRALENDWIGQIIVSHDQICSCEQPWKHLAHKLKEQGLKWPLTDGTTGEKDTKEEEDDDHFTEGDLDQLFNFEKEDAER